MARTLWPCDGCDCLQLMLLHRLLSRNHRLILAPFLDGRSEVMSRHAASLIAETKKLQKKDNAQGHLPYGTATAAES